MGKNCPARCISHVFFKICSNNMMCLGIHYIFNQNEIKIIQNRLPRYPKQNAVSLHFVCFFHKSEVLYSFPKDEIQEKGNIVFRKNFQKSDTWQIKDRKSIASSIAPCIFTRSKTSLCFLNGRSLAVKIQRKGPKIQRKRPKIQRKRPKNPPKSLQNECT